MMKYLLLIIVLGSSLFNESYSQEKTSFQWMITPFQRNVFFQNTGQFNWVKDLSTDKAKVIVDKSFKAIITDKGDIIYRLKQTNYIKDKSIPKEKRILHDYEIVRSTWLNANFDNITFINQVSSSYDFITKDKETLHSEGFECVLIEDAYPFIDLLFEFTSEENLKYSLVLYPGASIEDVGFKYDKVVGLNEEGDLVISTDHGDILEKAPYAYRRKDNKKIDASFKIKEGETLGFSLNKGKTIRDTLILDPEIIIPTTNMPVLDNGVDDLGNIYIYGGAALNFLVEKYSPNGTLLRSVTPTIVDMSFYGDLLVDGNGDYYISEGFNSFAGAKTHKFSSNSSYIWGTAADPLFEEHWRLSKSCVNGKVIVAGGGTDTNTYNIAEIDALTGVVSNSKSVHSPRGDACGVVTDDIGNSYLVLSLPNVLSFVDQNNNVKSNLPTSFGFSELGASHTSFYPDHGVFTGSDLGNGYNMMAIQGKYLYVSDGGVLQQWDTATYSLVKSVSLGGAIPKMGSGIETDRCNIYVGANNGIHHFDTSLNLLNIIPASSPIIDMCFSSSGKEMIVSGDNYLASLTIPRQACFDVDTNFYFDSCKSSINSISITPYNGIIPYQIFWTDGDTSFTRNNLLPGTYHYSVEDGGCKGSLYCDSIIIPDISFAIDVYSDTVCQGSNSTLVGYQMNDSVSYQASYYWVVDTNVIASSDTLMYVFPNGGEYAVALYASTANGCFDTVVDTVLVYQSPIIAFEVMNTCQNDTTRFVNQSVLSSVNNSGEYLWNFGDGMIDTNENAKHSYDLDSVYLVELIGTNYLGCKDSLTKSLKINPKPVADFLVDSVLCENELAVLSNLSSISTGTLQTFKWDLSYPNNLIDYNLNPSVSYTQDGFYTVYLTVYSDSNCYDTISKMLQVLDNPKAGFLSAGACAGDSLYLVDTSSSFQDNIAKRLWEINQNTYFDSVIEIVFNQPGFYSTKLKVETSYGCKDSISGQIEIFSLPEADFITQNNCLNDTSSFFNVSFTNQSQDAIDLLEWDFGDGNLSVGDTVSHRYANEGNYFVKLKTTSLFGCRDSVFHDIVVFALPTADFLIDNACVDQLIQINDASISNDSLTIVTDWLWDLDVPNNVYADVPNPAYSYANRGTKTVKLWIQTDSGCMDSISKTIEVYEKPMVLFSGNDVCFGDSSFFMQQSILFNDTIANYYWQVEGNVVANKNLSYVFGSSGQKQVKLKVVTQKGCVDSVVGLTEIYPLPVADFDYFPKDITTDYPFVCFENNSSYANSYVWNYDLGRAFFGVDTCVFYTVIGDTTLDVLLIATDSNGCMDSLMRNLHIRQGFTIYIPNSFSPNGDGFNDYFSPVLIGIVDAELAIYNRWGKLIYESADLFSWDGMYRGETVEEGVYVYTIKGLAENGKWFNKKGHVLLLK